MSGRLWKMTSMMTPRHKFHSSLILGECVSKKGRLAKRVGIKGLGTKLDEPMINLA
jgi:hypothetical protein